MRRHPSVPPITPRLPRGRRDRPYRLRVNAMLRDPGACGSSILRVTGWPVAMCPGGEPPGHMGQLACGRSYFCTRRCPFARTTSVRAPGGAASASRLPFSACRLNFVAAGRQASVPVEVATDRRLTTKPGPDLRGGRATPVLTHWRNSRSLQAVTTMTATAASAV